VIDRKPRLEVPEVEAKSLDGMQVILVEAAEAAAGRARQRHLDEVVATLVRRQEAARVADVQAHARALQQTARVVTELLLSRSATCG